VKLRNSKSSCLRIFAQTVLEAKIGHAKVKNPSCKGTPSSRLQASRFRPEELLRRKSMRNETKTISLSLNFNDENRYHFTVEIPEKTHSEDVRHLAAVNFAGEEFPLGALGKTLMRLLMQLDHATKRGARVWYDPGFWNLHAPPTKRRMAAMHAEVSFVKVGEPTAEVSLPAACIPSADVSVIQGEFSPKAK
jgi:hypothetical protein